MFGQSRGNSKDSIRDQARMSGVPASSSYVGQHMGIHSFGTFNRYLKIILNICHYSKEHYGNNKIMNTNARVINAFVKDKLSMSHKAGTIGQINAAIMKMAQAMDLRSGDNDNAAVKAFRIAIADARQGMKLEYPKMNRAYSNPSAIQNELQSDKSRVAVQLIAETGMRISNCTKIKPEQLNNTELSWKSKGGYQNLQTISSELAAKLNEYFRSEGSFYLAEHTLRADVMQACKKAGEIYKGKGIHGFRYSFAQEKHENMMSEGYSREEANAAVSELLSHHREDITERYLKH